MLQSEAKLLAERYFSGTIIRDDEKKLLDFIEESKDNMLLFRSWEKEWTETCDVDDDTARAWYEFSAHMLENDAKPARVVSIRSIFHIAASVALIIASTILATLYFSTPEEKFYALSVPMGSKTNIVLPDGSKVWLNAGSTIRYSTKFNEQNRNIELDGEGYFEVAKNANAEFTVKTSGYDVVVKGTHFNISAYGDDQYVTTTLMKGSVQINRGADQLLMKPGEMVCYNNVTGVLTKKLFHNKSNAWLSGMDDYDDITVGEFAKKLSRRYDVNIHINSNKIRNTRISITLRNELTIDEVMDALQNVTRVNLVRKGKDIYMTE